jgi:type II secretory pathway pseudopilin PulG
MAGWSLLELAVVLVIMGLIGMVVWRMVPLGHQVAAGDVATDALQRSEQAIEGFARANHRLPAADSDDGSGRGGDGKEDAGQTVGWLPVRTLGLPGDLRVRYEAATTLSSAPGKRFAPLLPPVAPTIAPNNGSAYSHTENGLDLCLALADAQRGSALKLGSNVDVAYALDFGGPRGNGNDHVDDAAGSNFPLPGSVPAIGRNEVAVGPGEFAVRLNCPDRVARTLAAARATYAAYDMTRFAKQFLDMRVFAVKVATTNTVFADINLAMATFDFVLGTAEEVIAIAQDVVGWPPASGVAFAAIAHVAAATGLGASIANVVLAGLNQKEAEEALEDHKAQLEAAKTYQQQIELLYSQNYRRLIELDAAGLNP